jgi:hypothetical protein
MSRRQRSRTLPQFSQPSSQISSEAEQPKLPDPAAVEIRYASTDDDVIAIHRFLLVVALPAMHAPVDPIGSLHEIIRVTKFEAAIMAILDGKLVGTLGVIKPRWWYSFQDERGDFLTDRWHFVLPQYWHTAVDKALIEEAHQIADMAGLKFFDQGKAREKKDGTFLMLPRIHIPKQGTLQ